MKDKGAKMRRELSPRDLSYFCMQISLMLDAGIALEDGVGLMRDEAKSSEESGLLKNIAEGLELRKPFHEVLSEAQVFPDYLVQMAQIGEVSGTMDRVMEGLSDYYNQEAQLQKDLKNAMTYPAVMVAVMLLILLLLSTQVMPIFRGVFEQLSVQMAPFTDLVIRGAAFFSGAGLAVSAAAIGFGWLLSLFGNRKGGLFAGVLQRMRSTGKLSGLVARRRLAQVMAIALQSGMSVDEGFLLAKGLVENGEVKERLDRCTESVLDGNGLADAVRDTGIFTGMQGQLIRIGQRAGRLEEILWRIADEYGAEADERINGTLARLEPALVAALSVITGGMLLLVMLPLLGILSSIG